MATTTLAGAVTNMATEIASHEQPACRADANFLIFADLSQDGMTDRWEQLWAHQLGEGEFRLCCIPFFAYGLALGDQVVTAPSGDKKYVIQSTVARSGHIAYRVWFGDAENTDESRDRIEQYVRSKGWLSEWSSENLLAVDIPSEQDEADVRSFMAEHADRGITFESGA